MKAWLISIIIVLALAVLALLGYFYLWPNYLQKYFVKEAVPVVSEEPEKVTDAGVSWIKPKKVADLGLIRTVAENPDSFIAEVQGYYKIADLATGGELFLAKALPEGPSAAQIFRFKKDAAGKFYYLVKNSDEKELTRFSAFLSQDVLDDYNTVYQSITPPDFLEVSGVTLRAGYGSGFFEDIKIGSVKIGDNRYGTVYRTPVEENSTDTSGVAYNLLLADSTYKSFIQKFAFMTDDEVPLVTWSDGSENTARFTAEGYVGCGSTASNNVIMSDTDVSSRLKQIGQTEAGEKIYTVSATDPVMQKAYENYRIGRETGALTLEQFAAAKAIFIWKAGTGDYVIFTDRNYGGLAECGKPVIYLYPEKKTSVNVKVAATITKSDPLYERGWQVVAEPSGKINYNGKVYPYLFWEGQGQNYPLITEGFVVKKEELTTVLDNHLTKLGLNAKEKADFKEYWLPKMPQTPFVRLTWFTTEQLNRLAPLEISPKPDTVIRIFLDFQGLNQSINLKEQKLGAIDRQGFTVIEWGGLLRGN